MVRNNSAHSLSDFATTDMTSLLVPDDMFEAAPPTKRLSAVDLARVVAEMNDPMDDSEPSGVHAVEALANMDEVPTVEALAPRTPSWVPSPLGDDGPVSSEQEGEIETLSLRDLDVHLDNAFAFLAKPMAATGSIPEARDGESPDAQRARRSVLASWAISTVITVVVTLLATGAQTNEREPRASAELTAAVR